MKFKIFLTSLIFCIFCFAANAQEPKNIFFNYGVSSGDPLTDRVILWTRVNTTETSASVYYEVASDQAFDKVVNSGNVKTSQDKDFTVKVDVERLKPGTYYYYRFKYKDSYSITGRTKTLPENTSKFRIAVVSCQNFGAGYYTAYKYIIKDNPDLIVMLGDFIYEYERGKAESVRPDNSGYAKDLKTYREKYRYYLSDHLLQEAMSQFPMVSIWDDHEVQNNYSGVTLKKTNPQKIKDAYQTFFEYIPIRELDEKFRIYRNFKVGNLVEFFLIDGRQYRDEDVCDRGLNFECTSKANIPGRTYLGQEQKKWLIDGITSSKAKWKFLGNNTVLMELAFLGNMINFDQWDGFYPEKEEFLKALKENNIKNTIVLTGDAHTFMYGNVLYKGEKVATEFVDSAITSGSSKTLMTYNLLVPIFINHMNYINPFYRGYILADFSTRNLDVYFEAISTVDNPDGERIHLNHFNIKSESSFKK